MLERVKKAQMAVERIISHLNNVLDFLSFISSCVLDFPIEMFCGLPREEILASPPMIDRLVENPIF